MDSLLFLSYKNTDISFSNLQTKYNHPVYHSIYDKIVNKTRTKIKNIITRHRAKLILRTIYLLKTKGFFYMFVEICGSLDLHNVSIWKISMIYSVITLDIFETKEERINDIIQNMDIVLKENDPCRTRVYKCINRITDSDNPNDLNLYIDAYIAFGQNIKI